MKPYLHGPPGFEVIMWNVGATVGRRGANSSPADVAYIQWYYKEAAAFHLTPPERRKIYREVKVTGHCTGRDDDPLVRAILANQEAMNHPRVDGLVSVAQGNGKIGTKAYFVLRLGARFATMHERQWPRLDHVAGCPASVAVMVKAAMPKIEIDPEDRAP